MMDTRFPRDLANQFVLSGKNFQKYKSVGVSAHTKTCAGYYFQCSSTILNVIIILSQMAPVV